jgi:hypothetical protein
MSQNIPQPIKDQYLNIRKALIRLKWNISLVLIIKLINIIYS